MLLSKVSNTADTPEHMIIAKPYIKNSFMLGLKSIFDTLSFLVMLTISFDTLLLVFIVNISIVKNNAEKGAILVTEDVYVNSIGGLVTATGDCRRA